MKRPPRPSKDKEQKVKCQFCPRSFSTPRWNTGKLGCLANKIMSIFFTETLKAFMWNCCTSLVVLQIN